MFRCICHQVYNDQPCFHIHCIVCRYRIWIFCQTNNYQNKNKAEEYVVSIDSLILFLFPIKLSESLVLVMYKLRSFYNIHVKRVSVTIEMLSVFWALQMITTKIIMNEMGLKITRLYKTKILNKNENLLKIILLTPFSLTECFYVLVACPIQQCYTDLTWLSFFIYYLSVCRLFRCMISAISMNRCDAK